MKPTFPSSLHKVAIKLQAQSFRKDREEHLRLIRRLRGRKRAIEVTRFLVPCDGPNGAVLLPGAGG